MATAAPPAPATAAAAPAGAGAATATDTPAAGAGATAATAAATKPPRIVFVSGCYDVVHGGHVEFFRQARALGDRLVVSVAGDAVLAAHKAGRRASMPTAHKASLLGALKPVDEVVIGDDLTERGLDFKRHFLRLRPAVLAVTEDDRYGDAKRRLCAEVGAEYVVLPKTLGYEQTSTTEILANIRAPDRLPLRVDFAGGWLDVPKHARPGAFVVNCAISPRVSLNDWRYHVGGGLGGSAAHAALKGRDAVASELDLGVGWQDPAVIRETGLCVWRSGPRPELEFKTRGAWLRGRMALLWTGEAHCTPDMTDKPRDYDLIEEAGRAARDAVAPGSSGGGDDDDAGDDEGARRARALATAIELSYRAQLGEGMAPLPEEERALARKYCGGGWGGYALYLFAAPGDRDAFVARAGADALAVEPYIS